MPVTGDPGKTPTASHYAMTAEKLANLLKSGTSGSLDKLVETARNMEVLTISIRSELAPDLADQVLSANLRDDGQLVIICGSSAWASRLRFESDAILRAAANAGFEATNLRVSVTHQS